MARELRFGVRLTGDSQGARTAMRATEGDLDRLQRELRSTRNAADRTERSFRNWSNSMNMVRGALGPLIGAAGVGMIARMGRQSLDAAANIDELADVAGISSERFQELTKAFSDMAGVTDSVTAGALRRFNRRLGLARQGTGAAVDTLDRLNISLRQDTGEALDEAVRKLADMEDGADRTAAASQLFGEDAGPRLAAALAQGNDALDDTIEKLREQGRIMDEDLTQSARDLNDRYNEIADTLNTKWMEAVINISRGFQVIFNTTEAQEIQNELDQLAQKRNEILDDLSRPRLLRVNPFASDAALRQDLNDTNQEMIDLQRRLQELQKQASGGTPNAGGDGDGGGVGGGEPDPIPLETFNPPNREAAHVDLVSREDRIQAKADEIWMRSLENAARSANDTLEMADGTVADLSVSLEEAEGSAGGFNDEMQNAISGWASTWSSALADAAMGAEDAFDGIVESFSRMLMQMVIQKRVVEPFLKWSFGDTTTQADGGVWSDGRQVQGYASGGVVTRPTVFPMANGIGLMGEAGPEAIMPLKRGPDGKLGVAGGGGGVALTVNIINESGEALEQSGSRQRRGPNGEQMIDVMVKSSIQRLDSQGQLDTVFRRHGARRQGAR